MKFGKFEEPAPTQDQHRFRETFAWLPTRVGQGWVWLEPIVASERWCIYGFMPGWEVVKYITPEEFEEDYGRFHLHNRRSNKLPTK